MCKQLLFSIALAAALSCPCFATTFEIGQAGLDADTNNWPENESPDHVIDGVGQKYLNFGKFNTGFAVTPSAGGSTATAIQLWAANDSAPRDPNGYEVWGTNEVLPEGASSFPLSLFDPISVGSFELPESRNDGGDNPLLTENSITMPFDNATSYSSYLVIFPSLKDPASANSMQIAEVQLFDAAGGGIFTPNDAVVGGQLVPEPATGLLAALASMGLLLMRGRRG